MIDLLTSAVQYRHHLGPIHAALKPEIRGADLHLVGTRAPAVARGLAALVGSGRDLDHAVALGYTRIAYAEHGIGQSYGNRHPAYPGGLRRDAVGLFLSPNRTAALADGAAYPEAWTAVIGDPRLDTLPPANPDLDAVAFSFHWDCKIAPETRTSFPLYAPALAKLADEIPLLGHAHPRIAPVIARWCRHHGIPFTEDFDEVVRRARLYICDNSSTLYEFASTGRPVLVLNAPQYRRTVEFGLRFWAASRVGLNVDSPAGLRDGVVAALEDPPQFKEERERALDIAYGARTGAARRAAWAIEEWL